MDGNKIGFYLVVLVFVFIVSSYANENSLDDQLDEMGIDKEIFQYRDLYTLTSSNFSSSVLGSFDPWVVVLHRGSVSREWKEAAVRSRGVVWFGMVNIDTERHLVREMKIKHLEEITAHNDRARVYSWGKRSKENSYRDVTKASAALDLAFESIPVEAIKSIEDSEDLNDLVMDCLLTAPTRFPAIFIYDPRTRFPPAFKSISIHLKRYFNFGRLDTELAHELVSVGVKQEDTSQSPSLIVVASKIAAGRKLRQRGIRCKLFDDPSDDDSENEEAKRVPSYTKMLECLYNINSQYRKDLPGNNMADDEEVKTMEDVLEQEQRRFQVNSKPAILASVGRKSGVNVEVVKGEPTEHDDPRIEL